MTIELFSRTRGQGVWLVMLHGLFGSGDNLGGLARALEAHFHILLIDLRNHGRSPHAGGMDYTAMARDVLTTMDREGIETAAVFGHSMGGKVAMQMALMEPERISSLIVGDIAPVTYGSHHDKILEGMQLVADAAPQSRQEAQALLKPYAGEDDVLAFLMTNWRRDTSGTWGWRINLPVIIHHYDDIAAGLDGGRYDGPVLFLRGEKSNYIEASYRDQIIDLFPRASVKTIGGTGHWLHAEKPDMVARSMLQFLKRVGKP